jgi:hypothetical protein
MRNQVITLPPSRTLAGFASEQGCDDGLAMESLEPGTMLIVRTDNSEYRMVALDHDRVLVEGGAMFPEPVPAVVQGAFCRWQLRENRLDWRRPQHRAVR